MDQKDFSGCKSTLVPSFSKKSHFIQNSMVNLINLLSVIICLYIGVWNLKLVLGHLLLKCQARSPWNFFGKWQQGWFGKIWKTFCTTLIIKSSQWVPYHLSFFNHTSFRTIMIQVKVYGKVAYLCSKKFPWPNDIFSLERFTEKLLGLLNDLFHCLFWYVIWCGKGRQTPLCYFVEEILLGKFSKVWKNKNFWNFYVVRIDHRIWYRWKPCSLV